jgi:acetate kinase
VTGLGWAGVELDGHANLAVAGTEAVISTAGSQVAVLVCPVDEESLICRDVAAVVLEAGGNLGY